VFRRGERDVRYSEGWRGGDVEGMRGPDKNWRKRQQDYRKLPS